MSNALVCYTCKHVYCNLILARTRGGVGIRCQPLKVYSDVKRKCITVGVYVCVYVRRFKLAEILVFLSFKRIIHR